ncbi:MAG: TIGR01459 family HAD-type hydrolase [Variibacter sp.]
MTSQSSPLTLTGNFASLAPRYDVVLSDIWGIVHNGVAAWPRACEALTRFRARGGTVVLISNAPRPSAEVVHFLDHLKVPRTAFDGIVTSGDVTRAVVADRPGQTIFHIGPERDLGVFKGLDVAFAPAEKADYVVCTGPFNDDVETPEDYRDLLGRLRTRNMFMVCGNPDLVVERGARLIYCGGAIADLYRTMGGDVLYAGKPYAPIYEQALAEARKLRGNDTALARVLAIGDSVRTDVKGADAQGLDCLFVTAGIHAEELGDRDEPDLANLERIFAAAGTRAMAVTRALVW